MVPAPIELKRGRGSSTTDRKICSTYRGWRLLLLAQRCGGCGTERSSEFGSVNPSRCRHARARRADSWELLRQSDLLEPPGRRCGCWRRRHFFFAELLLGRFRFGADDGAVAIDADVGFAGSERRRWCRRRSSKRRVWGPDN